MRKMIIESDLGKEVDADYYGMVNVGLPIVLVCYEDDLSNNELISLFAETIDLSKSFELIKEIKELYKVRDAIEVPNVNKLKNDLNALRKSKNQLKDLNLELNQLDDIIKEKELELNVAKNYKKNYTNYDSRIKDLEYKINYFNNNEVKLLLNGRNLNDVELHDLDFNKLVLNNYQIEFIKFLNDRNWDILDISDTINRHTNVDYHVDENYDEFNKIMKKCKINIL